MERNLDEEFTFVLIKYSTDKCLVQHIKIYRALVMQVDSDMIFHHAGQFWHANVLESTAAIGTHRHLMTISSLQ